MDGIWGVGFTIGGAAVGYIAGLKKQSAELSQLRAEAVKDVGESLAKLQAARKAYGDAATRCGTCASKLLGLVKASAAIGEIDEERERLCGVFHDEVIPRFFDEAEWVLLDCGQVNELEAFQEAEEDIYRELTRFVNWLSVINHPNLLSGLNKAPAIVEERTMRPLHRVVRRFPKSMRTTSSRRLYQFLPQLVQNPSVKGLE